MRIISPDVVVKRAFQTSQLQNKESNQDKFVTQCPFDLIQEFIGSIKHVSGLGFASPDTIFIDPINFRIRSIRHCVTNIILPPADLWEFHRLKDVTW